jgi:hypothetical protein
LLGVRQLCQLGVTYRDQGDSGALERCFERLPAGCTFESRRHCGATKGDPGADSFFNQAHTLRECQTSALTTPAEPEIPD